MTYRNVLVGLLAVPTLVVLGACSDDNNATPQVIFDGNLSLGTHSTTECAENGGPSVTVGSFGNLQSNPPVASAAVKDGDEFNGGKASVACSVVSAGGNAFNVSGTVDLSGSNGGVFRVDGSFTTTGTQNNIHAIFSKRSSGNSYEEQDRTCTVTYTGNQGVVAGRVWGQITCPNMVNTNANTTCAMNAEFRFENCAQ